MLLRITRRPSLCESDDVEEVLESAFTKFDSPALDLELSTYEVTREVVARVKAEHAAAQPLDPPQKGCGAFDLEGLVDDVRPTPCNSKVFANLVALHRDVHFQSEGHVREVVTRVVSERRAIRTDHLNIAAYAYGRVQAADPEWAQALDGMHESRRQRWNKFLQTAVPKPAGAS